MTDAHCHVSCGDPAVRELLVGRDFFGIHPWETLGTDPEMLKVEIGSDRVALGSDRVGLESIRVALGSDRVGLESIRVALGSDRVGLESIRVALGSDRVGLESIRVALGSDSVPSVLTLTDSKSTLTDSKPTLIDPNLSNLRQALLDHPNAGVGEIGLDRLKCREIPPLMRELFESQLALALELRRPVVLHGAKCWGQVVRTVERAVADRHSTTGGRQSGISHEPVVGNHQLPVFLFHGFSRSDGLIPDIVRLNGFISVGPAILNDHAVNYREMAKKIPMDRLLVETDRTSDGGQPHIRDVIAKTAEILGLSFADLERITDANALAFFPATRNP